MLSITENVLDLFEAQLGERLVGTFVRERHNIALSVVNHANLLGKEQYLVDVEPELFPRILETVAIVLHEERCSRQVSQIHYLVVAVVFAEHGLGSDVILRIIFSSLRLDSVQFQSDDHEGATRVDLIVDDHKLVCYLAVDGSGLARIKRFRRHFKFHEFFAAICILGYVKWRLAVAETVEDYHARE